MKCQSCKEDVSPKFKAAIKSNSCPFCGDRIIPEKLQIILNDLADIMKETIEFADEVADWLYTNYNFKKIDPKTVAIAEEVDDDDDDDELTPFMKRSGVKIKPKGNKFKEVIAHIQSEEDGEDMPLPQEPQDYEDLEKQNILVDVDPNAPPLNISEQRQMIDLFDNSAIKQELEADKLQRLRKLMAANVVLKRSE